MKENCIIQLMGVHKFINNKNILSDINLQIYKNETIALLGSNGAGKSTLLNVIAGLSAINKGYRNMFAGNTISYVHDQFPQLIISPREYFYFLGNINGLTKKTLNKRVDELSELFSITNHLDTKIMYFSKGMIQKVNLIQALIVIPDLLLLDEPLTGLDISSQLEFVRLLKELKKQGISMIVSSHEPFILNEVSDRIIQLQNGKITKNETVSKTIKTDWVEVKFYIPDLSKIDKEKIILLEKLNEKNFKVTINKSEREKFLLDIIQAKGTVDSLNDIRTF